MNLRLHLLHLVAFVASAATPVVCRGEAGFAQSGLACAFSRSALNRISAEPLTVDGLDGALILLQEAVALDPDDPGIWRSMLNVATLAEREDLRSRAIERLSQLDPQDEWVRFLRLNAAIDAYQTADARERAYQTLLSDENIGKLGPALSSRLALDLALLQQRLGNVEAFARMLTKALTLDSSNRSAAALAAGFFRMNSQDPFAEAELLTNLMLADPTDVTAQVALAQLLLEHGAYAGSSRIYRIAARSVRSALSMPTNDMLADMAIAQWASGDSEGALDTIQRRQAEIDQTYRAYYRREHPDVGALELAKISGPTDPNLATVKAVIVQSRGKAEAQAAMNAAIAAYQSQIDALLAEARSENKPAATQPEQETDEKTRSRNQRLASLYLQMAWVMTWLGDDTQKVADWMIAAEEREPLSDQAKQRFEGCVALRRGDAAKAAATLQPLAESGDAAARVGFALALLQQDQKKDAAKQLLAANQAQPGSLIGIWASNRLTELLGRRLPLSDQASKLENLVGTIPAVFDRYPDDASLVMTMRLVPARANLQAFEPVRVSIELTNNSQFPLALDREGPIRPQVLITPIVRSSANAPLNDLRPFVVDIGRKLRLAPRESVTAQFDMRDYVAAEGLNVAALDGAIVRLKGYINFIAGREAEITPGLYGMEVEAPIMRIDGVKVKPGWIEETVAAMQSPGDDDVLKKMAFLSHKIAVTPGPETPQEERRLVETARAAMAEAFAKLDAPSQAWLLCTMARGEGMAQVVTAARRSNDRLVQIAYLLYWVEGWKDPMLDAAKRKSDDAALSRLASIVQADAKREAEQPKRP